MTASKTFILLIFFSVGIMISFMPYLTRKTESFGVFIPESYYERKDLRQMRRQYCLIMLTTNIVLGILLFLLVTKASEGVIEIGVALGIILYLLLGFLAYLPFHFKMKKLKQEENWKEDFIEETVVDLAFRKEAMTLSKYYYLLPLGISLATALYSFLMYDAFPDEVWRHISFSGEITYTEKTPGSLMQLPILQLFLIGLFLFVDYIIANSKQQLSPSNPETSKKQNLLFRRRWSIFLFLSASLMVAMFSFMQLSMLYENLLPYLDFVNYTTIGFILLGSIWLSLQTGQGGSRIEVEGKKDSKKVERDEDRYWKLGQFYFNKEDPSIFVEKRFGIGWTNNWAHPLSWILLILLIGLPLVIILIVNQL